MVLIGLILVLRRIVILLILVDNINSNNETIFINLNNNYYV